MHLCSWGSNVHILEMIFKTICEKERNIRNYFLFCSADVVKIFEEAWGEIKGDCPLYFR